MDPQPKTPVEADVAPQTFTVAHAMHRTSLFRRVRNGSLVAGHNEVAFVPFLDAQPQQIHAYADIRHAEVTRGWRSARLTLHTAQGRRHFGCRATEEEITAMAAFVVERLDEPAKRLLRPRYRLTRLAALRAPWDIGLPREPLALGASPAASVPTLAGSVDSITAEGAVPARSLLRRVEDKVRRDWKVLAVILMLMLAEGWWFYRLIVDEPSSPAVAPIGAPQSAGPPGEPAEPAAVFQEQPRVLVQLLEMLEDETRRAELGASLMNRRIVLGRTRDDVASSVGWSTARLAGFEEEGSRVDLMQLGALAMTLGLDIDMLAMGDGH